MKLLLALYFVLNHTTDTHQQVVELIDTLEQSGYEYYISEYDDKEDVKREEKE